ncbi:hypothetical protein CPB85DRAFT_365391 [Mucidula mucida]|nr:hypothetical protein CPB85DRAFT_365391 [Mucidula mucida]
MPSATIRIPPRASESLYKSDAARIREEKLRADPHVTIISPQMVQCKRCDAQIKLSNVYSYEASHWKTHRSRCLKKTPKFMKESRRSRHSQTPALSAEPSFPPARHLPLPRTMTMVRKGATSPRTTDRARPLLRSLCQNVFYVPLSSKSILMLCMASPPIPL